MGTSSSSHSPDPAATGIAAIVVVGTVVIGLGYLLYKGIRYYLVNGVNGVRQPPHQHGAFSNGDSMYNFIPECASFDDDPRDNTIVIAVDATKERAGGVLKFPRIERIYFYSIDWSTRLRFPDEPDKFEMANVFLALEIFEDKLSYYRDWTRGRIQSPPDPLVCKNDNNIWLSEDSYKTGGTRNGEYRELFLRIKKKLASPPFNAGQVKHVTKPSCKDLKIADKLSRLAVRSDSLPVIDSFDYSGYQYDPDQVRNVSFGDAASKALDALEEALPQELKR